MKNPKAKDRITIFLPKNPTTIHGVVFMDSNDKPIAGSPITPIKIEPGDWIKITFVDPKEVLSRSARPDESKGGA